MELNGAVVLITGAAVRVGRAIALHLAEQGAHIAFSYYLTEEPWEQTKAEIEALDVQALAVQTEVRDADQIRGLVAAAVERFGRVDVLINSASIFLKTPFLDISEQEWELSVDVNLKGPFLLSQAVAPFMLAQGKGVIINITDLTAFQVWPGYAHHAAGKAGLMSLTKSMAVELAPQVRVNAIAPGTVLMEDDFQPERLEWAVDKSLLKRVGSPLDVARLAAFLIENEFTTGAVYFVDGGRSLL